MIVSRSYFQGNIHIPNSSDTAPNSNLLGNGNLLDLFIDEFERDVLTKCLGYSLYNEFLEQFNSENKLQANVNQKWTDLLDGKKYQIDGKTVKWNGLIFKQGKLDRSLIAYYVYYHFLDDDISNYTGTGVQSEKTKNSEKASPIPKVVRAWRKFYQLTVGNFNIPQIIENNYSVGVDWLNCDNGMKSLYQFIQDMNNITPETYPNWKPSFV